MINVNTPNNLKIPRPLQDIGAEIMKEAIEQLEYSKALDIRRYVPLTQEEKAEEFRLLGHTPHEKQRIMHECDARFIVCGGGRRGGKTHFAVMETLALARRRPYSLIYIVAPTKKLLAPFWEKMKEVIETRGIILTRDVDSQQEKIVELENHSEIVGISAEMDIQLVGRGLDFVVIDEAAMISDETWEKRLRPALTDKRGGGIMIGSLEGQNWYYERLQAVKEATAKGIELPWESRWEGFEFATWDNTAVFEGFNDPEIQEALASAVDKATFWEQYGAQARESKRLVLPEYSKKIHPADWARYDPDLPVWIAIDPGESSAYAMLVFQEIYDCPCWQLAGIPGTPQNLPHILVVDEFYQKLGITEDAIYYARNQPWFRDLKSRGWGYVDVTNAEGEARRWREKGVRINKVHKSSKDFSKTSIDFYRTFLRDPERYKLEIESIMDTYLQQEGKSIYELPPEEYKMRFTLVEQQRDLLTPVYTRCNRLHILNTLPYTQLEHENWRYSDPKKDYMNPPDKPMRAYDHTVDCVRYFLWEKHHKRTTSEPVSYIIRPNTQLKGFIGDR